MSHILDNFDLLLESGAKSSIQYVSELENSLTVAHYNINILILNINKKNKKKLWYILST